MTEYMDVSEVKQAIYDSLPQFSRDLTKLIAEFAIAADCAYEIKDTVLKFDGVGNWHHGGRLVYNNGGWNRDDTEWNGKAESASDIERDIYACTLNRLPFDDMELQDLLLGELNFRFPNNEHDEGDCRVCKKSRLS